MKLFGNCVETVSETADETAYRGNAVRMTISIENMYEHPLLHALIFATEHCYSKKAFKNQSINFLSIRLYVRLY